MKLSTFSGFALVLCAWLGAPQSAAATNSISWVSSTGSGSSCTRAAPCGDFSTALSQTNSGGVINCADSGFYGTIPTTQSVVIDCRGVHATAFVLQITNNISVIVRGIAFEGMGNSFSGIFITASATVVVEDCTVSGFASGGPLAGHAVYIRPSLSGAAARLTLKNVKLDNNGNNGVYVDSTATSSPIHVSVRDSLISSNAGSGIVTSASSATEIRLMVTNTEISKNGIGVNSNGGLSHVIVGSSVITENQVGFATAGGGAIYSYGTNQINGNNNDNVGVSTLIPQN